MNVTLVDDPELVAMLGYPKTQERTLQVVHQSDIIKRLMQRLQPKRFGGEFKMDPRVEMGILFENMLEQALVQKYATLRPGEIVSDEGVYMSPDGINPLLDAGEEYKATFMSCRPDKDAPSDDPKYVVLDEVGMPRLKFIHWFFQMKGYAKWLQVERFLLRVLFVCGDYMRPITPCFKTFDIRFTQEEIDENWAMLMVFARSEKIL